jgi:UrcA family protein
MKRKTALLIVGLALTATAASAQSYGPVTPEAGTNEVVTVTAPRAHQRQRSDIGAPIVNVALSREVRFDDLDLTTAHGVRELRARVRDAASTLCREIDQQYLVTEDDSRSCVSAALDDAMGQADAVIAGARS